MFHRKDLLLRGGVYRSREIEFLKKKIDHIYMCTVISFFYIFYFLECHYILERKKEIEEGKRLRGWHIGTGTWGKSSKIRGKYSNQYIV